MQPTLALFPSLGWPEIVVILVVFILLFGAKKLPELARSMGKSIKEFKKATSNIEDDIRSAMEDEDEPDSRPKPKTAEPGQTKAESPSRKSEADEESVGKK